MSFIRSPLIVILPLIAVLACNPGQPAGPSTAAAQAQPSAKPPSISSLAGNWSGDSRIVVDWVQQKQIPIQLVVAADGSVSGKVGDATLVDAKLAYSRSAIERSMGWGRDFRIRGKLQGDLVAAEKVHRDGVDIVFNATDAATLQGGLATSGVEIGPRDQMKISAGSMVLRKAAGASTRP